MDKVFTADDIVRACYVAGVSAGGMVILLRALGITDDEMAAIDERVAPPVLAPDAPPYLVRMLRFNAEQEQQIKDDLRGLAEHFLGKVAEREKEEGDDKGEDYLQ